MSISKRRRRIIDILKLKNIVNIKEMASTLNVSEMTLYRDIKEMEDNLFLSKRNMIYRNDTSSTELPYYARMKNNVELKVSIAKVAVNYINNNDTIFLDGSSTIAYLVRELVKKDIYITVVTISPIISNELAKKNNINILCPGGLLDKINMIYNCEIDDFLKTININKAFMSCGALSLEKGFTDLSIAESKIKSKIIEKVPIINLLVDHSKISNSFPYTWSGFEKLDRLICDYKTSEVSINELKSKKIEVIISDGSDQMEVT